MKMVDIQYRAVAMGLKPGKLNKTDLIRSIQSEEGNSSCFRTDASRQCTQESCCWRDDCRAEPAD